MAFRINPIGYLLFLLPWIVSMLWTSIFTVTVTDASSSSSATSSSSYTYTSVTALDKYGNSVQLQHAQEAVTRYGATIVAASFDKGIVVVSIRAARKFGIIMDDDEEDEGNASLIQTLSPPYSSSSLSSSPSPTATTTSMSVMMAVVCTGLKADAKWLIATLRDYQKRNWELYNTQHLSTKTALQAMTHALLTFMGYNRNKELHDGLLVVAPPTSGDDGDGHDNGGGSSSAWSRPLGVQTMLLTSDHTIAVMGPSGTCSNTNTGSSGGGGIANTAFYLAHAIGRKSQEMNDKLEEHYVPNQTLEQVQTLLMDLMKQVFESKTNDVKLQFVVEVMTNDGVERRHLSVEK